ncbi:MAG: NAD-dependent epimerase/dehydratase family protein [Patescibacteria group bacterium]
MSKILITGAFGQIGSELVPVLQQKYGLDNVIAAGHSNLPEKFVGISEKISISDTSSLNDVIKKYNIDTIYHLASFLSAKCERDPDLAWQVNMGGLKNILDLARDKKLKVFWPSSIGAFGPTTPKINTPQHTIMEPTTIYGVTKLAGELLCQYYFLKYGVDVRSVRYPGIITYKTEPSDGTTEYSITMLYEAAKGVKVFSCFLTDNTLLPMMYIDDAIWATIALMDAPAENIKIRTSYNLAAISFSPKELLQEINKYIPDFVCEYKPDFHQAIADSWPKTINDNEAREQWGWGHQYDLTKMTKLILDKLREKFGKS